MSNPLNILIVEDEMLISEMLKEMLLELGYNEVTQAKNYNEAVQFLTQKNFELVFLDINLNEGKTGIDVAKKLNNTQEAPFIYLTSFSDKKTLHEAAITQPLNYLTKPFTLNDIQVALIMFSGKKEPVIIVKEGHLKVKLKVTDICCIKSENNYLDIYSNGKKYVIRQSLDGFLDDIKSPKLVRVHRSHVVNIDKVDAVNGQYILVGKEKIPLSRKHRDLVLSQFSQRA